MLDEYEARFQTSKPEILPSRHRKFARMGIRKTTGERNILLAASMGLFTGPERTGFSAFFLPSAVYLLDHAKWLLRPAIGVAAFVAQWLLIALLVGLREKTIDELECASRGSNVDEFCDSAHRCSLPNGMI